MLRQPFTGIADTPPQQGEGQVVCLGPVHAGRMIWSNNCSAKPAGDISSAELYEWQGPGCRAAFHLQVLTRFMHSRARGVPCYPLLPCLHNECENASHGAHKPPTNRSGYSSVTSSSMSFVTYIQYTHSLHGPSVQVIIRHSPTKRLTRNIIPVFSYSVFFLSFFSGIIRISSETVYRPGNMTLSRIYCGIKMQSWKTSFYLRCTCRVSKIDVYLYAIWTGQELEDTM